jgi:hypothetical protein
VRLSMEKERGDLISMYFDISRVKENERVGCE